MRHTLVLAAVACLVLAGAAPAAGAMPAAGTAADPGDAAPADAAPTDGDGNATADNATTVTLLAYNDIQTAAVGTTDPANRTFSRLVALVNQRRAAHDNPVTTAGAGDQVGPHALAAFESWRPPVEVLNVLEPDADAIGNHELDYVDPRAGQSPERNVSSVANFTAASEFPWLLANVVEANGSEGLPGTAATTVVERGGVRVGYVGLADEGAMNGKTDDAIDESGYEVRDFATVGADVARELERERDVDVVVALAHTGVSDAKRLANASDAVDVIVVGDDEVYYPPRETNGTIILEGVARAQYLGEVNLTVSDGEVVAWDGRLIPVTEAVPRNRTAAGIVDGYRAEYALDANVTRTAVPLDARFATNYHRESNYGNYVTDAMRRATGADVAVQNAGGIRSNSVYGPGALTGGDVLSTLPFGNTIHVVTLNGTELRAALASQIVTLESETGREFGEEISQQVSGVTFEWVPHDRPGVPGGEIRDLKVGGEPVDPNGTYTVAAPSFIAEGGSGYPLADEPRNRTGVYTATAVLDAMRAADRIAPTVEGRMRRVDTAVAPATVNRTAGNDTVVVRMGTPANFTALGDGVVVRNGTTGRLAAESSRVRDGRIEATFDADEFDALAAGSADLDVYAEYADDRYTPRLNYFDRVVVNAELPAAGAAPPALPGADAPPTDPDDDGVYEDVDGDGEFDVFDVQVLLDNLDAPAVRDHPAAFDADGRDGVDVFDVQALLDDL